MSWWWRTKPRNILRTVQWFSDFSKLEGKNWDFETINSGKKTHPVRREYIYNAHSEEDPYISKLSYNEFLSGTKDKKGKDAESNGRNDKITFEFFGFGYIDTSGCIRTTDVGKRIISGNFDGEDYLKQLLKLQFPNPISSGKDFSKDDFIYPLELICKAIQDFDYLNRSELVLLFGCNNISRYSEIKNAILNFRNKYNKLPKKNKNYEVINICKTVYTELYGKEDAKKLLTYYEYAEALCRCLNYTGIFKTHGRSIATKVSVPDYSRIKFNLLCSAYSFEYKKFGSLHDYMKWYGDPDSIILPWNNSSARIEIIKEKIEYINKNKNLIINAAGSESYKSNLSEANKIITSKSCDYSKLKDQEKKLVNLIIDAKENEFINSSSKTEETRQEILDMYDEILDQIDMSALWLEVNTWKSLVAINGRKTVIRNFEIEEDLTPKSFAPGIGNTPDMEMYLDEYIIIPEVSLMTGVRQWEHEASSVIDHVLSFIEDYKEKKVIGLFISSSINIRTKWQFFILNKESWVGKPVPVIPLTISQYKQIISKFYSKNLDISEFAKVIIDLHKIATDAKDYNDWFIKSDSYLSSSPILA